MTPTFTTFCAAAGPAITTASTSDKNAVSVMRMSSSPLLYLGSPGPIGPAFLFGKHAPRVSADAGGESAIDRAGQINWPQSEAVQTRYGLPRSVFALTRSSRRDCATPQC